MTTFGSPTPGNPASGTGNTGASGAADASATASGLHTPGSGLYPPLNDGLFGRLCIDRDLVSMAELESALDDQRRLKSLGIDRPIGELLVARGVLSRDDAESVAAQQARIDPEQADVAFAHLAETAGLVDSHRLMRAMSRQRALWRETSALPSLAFVLLEDGDLTVGQVDALVQLMQRLDERSQRDRDAGHDLLADLTPTGRTGGGGTPGYLVTLEGEEAGTLVLRLLTRPEVEAELRSGGLNADDPVQRDDLEGTLPIRRLPEFAQAVARAAERDSAQSRRRRAVAADPLPTRRFRPGRRTLAAVLGGLLVAAIGALIGGELAAPRVDAPVLTPTGRLPDDVLREFEPGPDEPADAVPIADARPAPGAESAADARRRLGLDLAELPWVGRIAVPVREAEIAAAWGEPARRPPNWQTVELPDRVIHGVPVRGGILSGDDRLIPVPEARLAAAERAYVAIAAELLGGGESLPTPAEAGAIPPAPAPDATPAQTGEWVTRRLAAADLADELTGRGPPADSASPPICASPGTPARNGPSARSCPAKTRPTRRAASSSTRRCR
jgi:hypothetical protein